MPQWDSNPRRKDHQNIAPDGLTTAPRRRLAKSRVSQLFFSRKVGSRATLAVSKSASVYRSVFPVALSLSYASYYIFFLGHVNVQDNCVNMQDEYVNMQHIHFDMQEIENSKMI
jgi:hypothetical protein